MELYRLKGAILQFMSIRLVHLVTPVSWEVFNMNEIFEQQSFAHNMTNVSISKIVYSFTITVLNQSIQKITTI